MKSNIQNKYRFKKFSSNQYWVVHFSEMLGGKLLGNYRTVIKARSGEMAKEILLKRISEENENIKLISILFYFFHKGFSRFSGVKLSSSISTWDHIRKISFPNEFNKIFKLKKDKKYSYLHPMGRGEQRPSKELNNERIARLKKFSDKKRGCVLPKSPEAKKRFGENSYVSLKDLTFKGMETKFLKGLMKKNKGNKSACGDELGIGSSAFRRYLQKFDGVDWNKEYPLTGTRERKKNTEAQRIGHIEAVKTLKSRGHKFFNFKNKEEVLNKAKKTRAKTWRKKKEENLKKIKTPFLDALRKNNFHQIRTSEELGMSVAWVSNVIRDLKIFYPNFKKEFDEVKDKKRNENHSFAKKKRREHQLNSCKHNILEAYHQFDGNSRQASKYLGMSPGTFRNFVKDIREGLQ
jgi:DNA-binding protein Fis